MPAGQVVVIAGPTASGKSALALDLAERRAGTVINADASQLYAPLRILTARPGREATTRVPHRLYGVVDDGRVISAAAWRDWALAAIRATLTAGRVPIVVGGTGLYLSTLMSGLAPMPDIPADVRAGARRLVARLGPEAMHARLARADPAMAARLRRRDRQRIARAWEVLAATGESLASWQQRPRVPPPPALSFALIRLMPSRADLDPAIQGRFEGMLAAGAAQEVAALAARTDIPTDHPIRRAIGVRELTAYLAGDIDRATAAERARHATRAYAKRQLTWLRRQLPAAEASHAGAGWPSLTRAERYHPGVGDAAASWLGWPG